MQRSKLQELGVAMMGVSWSACGTLSLAGVGSVSILSAIFSDTFKLSVSNPTAFFWYLLIYGLPAAIAIGVITVVLKGLLYYSGRGLVWIGVRLSNVVPTPDIPIPVGRSEFKRLFRVVEKKIDKRSRVLKKAGLNVEKHVVKNKSYSYKFFYKTYPIYYFAMMIDDENDRNSVAFSDGLMEPKQNRYTALGKICATLGNPKPMVFVRNISLLSSDNGVIRSGLFYYNELAEMAWSKASRTIEAKMNPKRHLTQRAADERESARSDES